jgi:hypothetical protein
MTEQLLHLRSLTHDPRLALAREQLSSGQGFVFEDVWFRLDGAELMVAALIHAPVSSVSDACAAGLIRRARAAFERVKADGRLGATIADAIPQFTVLCDRGTSTTMLCRVIGDELVWTDSR